jgi:hypothetical protein
MLVGLQVPPRSSSYATFNIRICNGRSHSQILPAPSMEPWIPESGPKTSSYLPRFRNGDISPARLDNVLRALDA